MLINLDKGYVHFEHVVVVVKREGSHITYNSGLLYLSHESYLELKSRLIDQPEATIHDVLVYNNDGSIADNYPRERKPNKLWCPFCMTLESWKNHKCPVCGMSDSEFWVAYHNGLRR